MSEYFLDSSALAKRYVSEPGSDWVCALVEGDQHVVVSRLSLIEVASALVRRCRNGQLTPDYCTSCVRRLIAEFAGRFEVIELDDEVMLAALSIVQSRGLRGADTLQLACAKIAVGLSEPSEFRFVSSDHELNAAALAEGLQPHDPSSDAPPNFSV